MAVNEIRKFIQELPVSWTRSSAFIQKALGNAMEHANRRMYSYAKKYFEVRGMGTTVVLAYLHTDDMHIAWAGDSRLYRFAGGLS